MNTSLLTQAITAATLLSTGHAHANWNNLGPSPAASGDAGRITALAAHPTDRDRFFASAATGGVWKHDLDGWTPLTEDMPAAAIGALAIAPSDGDVIYAGSGEANFAPPLLLWSRPL
ncbi:MAG: hypothetical protein V3V08_05985 [Nannocystaceae bacterium]